MAVTKCKDKLTTTATVSSTLAAATASLLGANSAQAEELYNDWSVDVGYLRYEEIDRISVNTYIGKIRGNLSEVDEVSLGIVFDTLSGSTPTGALPGEGGSITGVSGGSVEAGTGGAGGLAPFDDTRLAIDASWDHEWGRLTRTGLGSYISVEGDYTAIGGSIGVERENKNRSTTYAASIGGAFDEVSRTGGDTPAPLAEVSSSADMFGPGKKNTVDALVGVTKVLNRRTVGVINFSYSKSLGYHTDPYKMISIADEDDIELNKIYENRPDERTRYILYTKVLHELVGKDHRVDFRMRNYTDDWGINSLTLDFGYAVKLKNGRTVEPFIRLYGATAADFYMRTIDYDPSMGTFEELTLPEFVSSDQRLAEMTTITLGSKFRLPVKEGSVDLRLGYMIQNFEDAIFDQNSAFFLTVDFGQFFE